MSEVVRPAPRLAGEVAPATIAIACYNQGHFLEGAIRSCLEQTLPPSEIIVVDDGSSDHTRSVAQRFPSVRYVFQANSGLSTARNTGLATAVTPLILFLDADDVLMPDALRAAIAAFDAAPAKPAFVHGGYQETDELGNVLTTHIAGARADPFGALLRGNYIAMHGAVLYDAAVLRASGGFDPRLRQCEDYDVYLRLARHHPIATYAEIAAHYRRHGASLSRKQVGMIETAVRVIERHAKRSARGPADIAAARAGRRMMIDYYARHLVADLRSDGLRTLRAVLPEVIRRPSVAGQLVGWAISRWTRAATVTG